MTVEKGHWQRGRQQVFSVHQVFGLPFFTQRSSIDHATRTRVVGDREVYAFQYVPEVIRPGSAFVHLAESVGAVGHLRGLATRLTRGLQTFLVTDDFFTPLPRLLALPPSPALLPPDEDPYDGRTWSVHGPAGLIESVLVSQMWELLTERGKGPAMSLLTTGPWLLWFPNKASGRRLGQSADLLAAAAGLIDAQLAQGLLDPWTIDSTGHLRLWQGTSFEVIEPIRSVLFYLWQLRSLDHLGEMIRGQHAGVDFIAVDGPRPNVLVALEHQVPDHVMLARSRTAANRGISTEWHEFNRDYLVTARHSRIGHAVATPRLIQFLYDNSIERIDVKGPWVTAQATDFTPAAIRETVEVLARSRAYLPSFPVGQYAFGG